MELELEASLNQRERLCQCRVFGQTFRSLHSSRAEEMTQQVRASVFAQNLGSIPSTHMVIHKQLLTLVPGYETRHTSGAHTYV